MPLLPAGALAGCPPSGVPLFSPGCPGEEGSNTEQVQVPSQLCHAVIHSQGPRGGWLLWHTRRSKHFSLTPE